MKDYTPTAPEFSNTIREPEYGDPAHPDTFNPAYEQLLQNDMVLLSQMPSLSFDDEKGVVIGGGGSGGGGGTYVLPTATGDRLGGVKIGGGIDVEEDGTISTNVESTAEHAADIAEESIASTENDFTDEDVDYIVNGKQGA